MQHTTILKWKRAKRIREQQRQTQEQYFRRQQSQETAWRQHFHEIGQAKRLGQYVRHEGRPAG